MQSDARGMGVGGRGVGSCRLFWGGGILSGIARVGFPHRESSSPDHPGPPLIIMTCAEIQAVRPGQPRRVLALLPENHV